MFVLIELFGGEADSSFGSQWIEDSGDSDKCLEDWGFMN